ncbi:unnamed protein product [Rangifer tarandus platyrhynchus]|uniref:Uncharacterized protein n=1 Tax=Rangifer tarandus platyrhynchus TaxID=3082113 RepID=A0ACB1KFE8_RANTA
MGAQGPGCAPPMPEGGSEDRGPRSVAGPNQTPPGPRGPEPRTGVGRGGADRGRAWRGPGREGAETSAPLTPTPSPGLHGRPAAQGPGNTPGPRAGPGLLARVAGAKSGTRRQIKEELEESSCTGTFSPDEDADHKVYTLTPVER